MSDETSRNSSNLADQPSRGKRNGGSAAAVHVAWDAQLAAKTLSGDLRDFILDRLKTAKKPFEKMSELEQKMLVGDVQQMAEIFTRRMVETVAAGSFAQISCTLQGITGRDEQLKLTMLGSRRTDARYDLLDALGATVVITIPGVEQFIGQRAPVKIQKDQPAIFDSTDAAGRA